MVEKLKNGQTGRLGRLDMTFIVIPSLLLSRRRGSLVELSTSKQSSQLARVRVTPGTRFIDIRITYSPSRTRSRRHTKKVEVIALCYKALWHCTLVEGDSRGYP